jgi:hypothetical protein
VELLPGWHEFLRALKRRRVRFLLVGGHALAAHGRPRFTQDVVRVFPERPLSAVTGNTLQLVPTRGVWQDLARARRRSKAFGR